jgi:threonine synthase
MAAYASAAGLQPVIFIPHGNISFGKLAQALEYGAKTIQVEANFDQILALVRTLADRLGIYLLNSMNPFRIEGQKTIMAEMLDQRDWRVPDWVVLPGGNLGNTSAFGKGLRELKELGLIDRIPRLAVIQAEGSAPFYDLMQAADRSKLTPVAHPETLATAIKIGDPVSWPKALHEVTTSGGVVERVSEQEIADAKAVIGDLGGNPQADGERGDAEGLRCGCSAYRKCPKRPQLYPSVPHRSFEDRRWGTNQTHIR